MEIIKKALKSRKFYELAFIAFGLISAGLWLIGLLKNGENSTQMGIFFGNCQNSFADTLNVVGYSAQKDVYHNTVFSDLSEKAYPPLTYMLMYFFSKFIDVDKYYANEWFVDMFKDEQFLVMFIIVAIFVTLFIYEAVRLSKNGSNAIKVFTAIVVCASAPMIFSYQRGNTIMLVLALELLYILWYDSDNKLKKEIALISLALVAAFKMTPALLGILLLYNKQWKDAIRAVIYGILAFFLPFLFFQGGFSNFSQMLTNMSLNVAAYNLRDGTTLMSIIAQFFDLDVSAVNIIKGISIGIAVILLILAYFMPKRWEKIAAVTIALVACVPHSEYYNMLYLVPAFIAFLNEEEHEYSDIVMLVAIFAMINDFQCDWTIYFFNYHLTVFLLTVLMLVKGVMHLVKWIKGRKNRKLSTEPDEGMAAESISG